MSERSEILVGIKDLPDNERLIFKLILSVSERSKHRKHFYKLSEQSDVADIFIAADCSSCAGSSVCVQVVNQNPGDTGVEYIQRPLIATRVLASLDRIVKQQDLQTRQATVQKQKETEKQEETETPVATSTAAVADSDVPPDQEATEQEATEMEMLDFSISEEEASELAIVPDEALTNPANRDEDEQFTGTAEGQELAQEPSNVKPLPVAEAIKETVEQAEVQDDGAEAVLVVDDSASVRKQLEIELDLFNAQVDFAEDAERAIDLLGKKPYAVVFLDVVLPDMDGFQICKKIKTDKEMKRTKVVMLTGKASHADKVRGSLAGCDAYLVKPVGRSTFQMAAKKYLTLVDNVEVMEA